MKKIHLFVTTAILTGVCLFSCKKQLNPALDTVTQTEAAGSPDYLKSIVLGTYTKLRYVSGNSDVLFNAECTGDACIVPTRIGGDWADGGTHIQFWLHQYTPAHGAISGAWNDIYNTVGSLNITIGLLQGLPATPATAKSIAELKVVRAYNYYLLLTNWGNVPLIVSSSTDASKAKTTAATDIYNFLITELKTNAPLLSSKTSSQDPSQYGRMNKWGAYFLLAKLYINQNVITGSTDNSGYTACSAYCDSLATAGYSLQPNFLDNFSSNNNQGNTENIFVVPYDHVYAQGENIQMTTFHYNQAAKYSWGSTGGPWNGFSTNADYFQMFNTSDTRRAGFQFGIQYQLDGVTPIRTRGSDSGLVLNFRPQVSSLTNATEYDGVRMQKWQLTPGNANQDADWACFRYADVLLMKAECLVRLGNPVAALSYTAPVRARAGMPNFSAGAFTLDTILNERGREFVWEGWRKEDLIRFGHFGDKKQFKNFVDPDKHAQLMPIPQTAINANPNLTQNPGY
jgi:hypothetical protein